jgi:D-glycero-alpha-D-manno-heptose-7-phosphate kinase
VIVTRTPFRVTLGGGGTDLPSFYREHGGFIFAMGIDKYMYIMLNPPIVDSRIRLHYSRSEVADHVSELQHELAREALRLHGVENRIEISSMADLPDGTGLGSSGAYLVGLLTALHQYRRDYVSLKTIAEEACHIELDVLDKAVGKQDQYMAAFGGMTVLDIHQDGRVDVRSVDVSGVSLETFVANTHLYYTGHRRSAVEVLQDQHTALQRPQAPDRNRVSEALLHIRDLGHRILDAVEREEYDDWGRLLDEHWQHKKRMSARISLAPVDELYDHVRSEYGVLGGKIAGAGGGGFLMLYAPGRHRELEAFMAAQGMPRLHYKIENGGAKVIADHANGRPMTPTRRVAPA